MCGITGVINITGQLVDPDILSRMSKSIEHRGPDGEGSWIHESVGIAHRRLAIIDRSFSGHQPMISTDGRLILSYNGEIYNYRELRSVLQGHGYAFSSNTDTEVVLYSLHHWGTKALSLFNGMFALALWDSKDKCLLLARDRYGIKPLYYSSKSSIFMFASEQKAIISHPSFVSNVNTYALVQYLTFQNLFTSDTLTQGIKLLPPGSFLELSPSKDPYPTITQYWDYCFQQSSGSVDEEELVEELDRLLVQAVDRQLVGDVELGSYLSGGIDSATIASIASRSLPNLKTFTCGFDLTTASGIELAYDERTQAEAMAALFKTEHYQMVLKAGDMERSFNELAYHIEEPRVGQSYPNYYVARLTSKFVKVALSGVGGDELFCGYPWRYYRTDSASTFDEYIDHYHNYWQRLLTNSQLKQVLAPIWPEISSISTRDIFQSVFRNQPFNFSTPEELINNSLYFEAKTFLHGLLVVEDKLSMAHGLENRVPFLDNDLVDFAMKCPVYHKLNNLSRILPMNENQAMPKTAVYYTKTNDGKKILRKVASRHIPPERAFALKQGFSSPDASWFKGESIRFVKDKLLKPDARIYDFLDIRIIEQLLYEHFTGKKNRRLLIWSLLSLEYHFDLFF